MPNQRTSRVNPASHQAMPKTAPASLLLLALALASSHHALADPPSSCKAYITGAAGIVNGVYPCSTRVIYNNHDHVLAFTLSFSPTGSGSLIDLSVTINAPQITPRAANFTLGAKNVTGSITLKQSAGNAALKWTAFVPDASTPAPVQATAQASQSTLKLDDLGSAINLGKQLTYSGQKGSISATLDSQPETGANGTVSVQLSFEPQ
jgi:hypothetical protein